MDIGLDSTWWIFVFTAIIDGVYGGMTRVFTHDSGASNLVPSGTTPVHVRRITQCARICSGKTSCIGFYHSDNQQSCDLNVGQNFTGFVADSTATYYTYSVSFESAPTSPTSTVTTSSSTTTTTQSSSTVHSFTAISPFTEVSSSNCPASYTPDIRILGSSGNYYTVKCVHQAENHTDAQTGCYGHGMTLFRPNNATKVNEVAAFLTACAAYDATSYWTDAQKHISEPGKPWMNSDGSNVPTSAWYSSLPGNQTGELCARLDGTRGYLLNDINCDHVDPTWGYICE